MDNWQAQDQDIMSILEKYQYLRAYDVFHQLQAYLLYPSSCSCRPPSCECNVLRKAIALSLNIEVYNQAIQTKAPAEELAAIKFFLRLPNDSRIRKNYKSAYGTRFIEKDFRGLLAEKRLQCVEALVITLLRLGKTHFLVLKEPLTSLKEAMDILMGSHSVIPVHSGYFGGEKAYTTHWTTYKALSPFIAALGAVQGWDHLPLSLSREQIEKVLPLTHWFRQALLQLRTPNVKEKAFLSEKDLLPLPPWISSQEADFHVEIFEEKEKALLDSAELIDPAERYRKRMEKKMEEEKRKKIVAAQGKEE